jgi:hypothetical protein
MPGEKLEFNLEGFLYRSAFGISGFFLQFQGFFDPPHQGRESVHPNPEVRLSHVVSAITDQLNGGQQLVTAEVSRMWQEQFGYAIQTLEQCLRAHGATRTPVSRDGQFYAMFHVQEIMARAKKEATDARQMSALIDPHRHRGIAEFLDSMRGQSLLAGRARSQMMGFDVQ